MKAPATSAPAPSTRPVTFSIIGHNEAPTLAAAIAQALEAKRAGDEVNFVDSASTDGSAEVARGLGVTVVPAPLGKGNAIAAAVKACRTRMLCCIDGDIFGSARNIPAELVREADRSGAGMIVGSFSDDGGVASNTIGVYSPLVEELFPEAVGRYGEKPLTGFRVFEVGDWLGRLPPDFGVEAHLNVRAALAGQRTAVADIGHYRGRFLYKPTMGTQIAKAILDLAEVDGRIDATGRAGWERWVADVVEVIAGFRGEPGGRELFRARLEEVAGRARPQVRLR